MTRRRLYACVDAWKFSADASVKRFARTRGRRARVDVGPQSAVMDALVEQRTEEVTHVFFHFLIRILDDERAKMSGDERDADFTSLLASERFTKCLLACAMEVVVTTYKTSTLAFPATTQLLGIHPFDLVTIIESFVRADAEAPRDSTTFSRRRGKNARTFGLVQGIESV